MKIKIPDMSVLCRDNLLLNSNFARGIINQQNKTSYTYSNKTMLTADSWISYGVNVAVASYYITVANRDTSSHTLRQPMKHKANKVTLYLNLKNVKGNIFVYFNGYTNKQQKLVEGEQTYTFDIESGEITVMSFNLEANASFDFVQGKLEHGEHFTGMPVWNEAIELFKCQSIFQTYTDVICPAVKLNGKLILTIPVYTKLLKKPTILITGYTNIYTPNGQRTGTVISVGYVNHDKNSLRCEIDTSNLASIPEQQPLIVQIEKITIDSNNY